MARGSPRAAADTGSRFAAMHCARTNDRGRPAAGSIGLGLGRNAQARGGRYTQGGARVGGVRASYGAHTISNAGKSLDGASVAKGTGSAGLT
jgi:hypothetical protein